MISSTMYCTSANPSPIKSQHNETTSTFKGSFYLDHTNVSNEGRPRLVQAWPYASSPIRQLTMKLTSKRIIPRLCTHAYGRDHTIWQRSSEMNLGLLYTQSPNRNVIWNHSTIRFIKNNMPTGERKRRRCKGETFENEKGSRCILRNYSSS